MSHSHDHLRVLRTLVSDNELRLKETRKTAARLRKLVNAGKKTSHFEKLNELSGSAGHEPAPGWNVARFSAAHHESGTSRSRLAFGFLLKNVDFGGRNKSSPRTNLFAEAAGAICSGAFPFIDWYAWRRASKEAEAFADSKPKLSFCSGAVVVGTVIFTVDGLFVGEKEWSPMDGFANQATFGTASEE
jgi:hypothetical protein